MKYPLSILKTVLKEAEEAQSICLLCYNKEDYLKIEEEVIIPTKTAIRLIGIAVENELTFKAEL
jgi:hypothetical protein